MRRSYWLVLALAVLSGFNAGTVWLMQFSGYPLWRYVGSGEFAAYFNFWQRIELGLLGFPFALSAACALILLFWAPAEARRWSRWAAAGLQAAVALQSWFQFWPIERDMVSPTGGMNVAAYEQLMAANWVRIGLVTAYAILIFWMLVRCLWAEPSVTRDRQVILVTSGLSLYGVGNVWLVQLLCYRLWPYVGQSSAYAYHIAWWHSIWGILFIPAGLVFLGSIAMLWIRPQGVSRRMAWAGFALQFLTYALTAAWWGPLMARLVTPEGAMPLHLYDLLITTHWLRLALITAYGATASWMLVKSATRPTWRTAGSSQPQTD